ncbi:arsenite methyltransferase [Salinilacihabitans rarus]|uniref:arsenite methyltransferase n=1 Tax=Salinilacihabitans rarus TaxID=2961596 RepID=UPI0020C90C3D|nr:arsenite methyltransferase [Salinilacihabitans rarus]
MTDTHANGDDDGSPADRRAAVRERYGAIASDDGGCCGSTCCDDADEPGKPAADLGYDPADLDAAPEGSNLGLGCGNPVALSNLEPGETVLDLGAGGGFDCFLAAEEVGPEGRVIGVDMTPEMVERARENARESPHGNVEFRLGEIEHLPVADGSVDVVISNCVLNLSPEKPRTLAEAYRALTPGGRLSVSDLVATEPLPEDLREDLDAVAACVGGAATVAELEGWLADVGFEAVEVVEEADWDRDGAEDVPIVSARIEARKPVDA